MSDFTVDPGDENALIIETLFDIRAAVYVILDLLTAEDEDDEEDS